jgi:hypothetical protein
MKKEFATLIILLLMSLTAFSQSATDSVVVIPKAIAIEIAKDLERLDQADSMLVLKDQEINALVQKITIQDAISVNQVNQISTLRAILADSQEIIGLHQQEVEHWKKQYRKQKRQKFLVGSAGLALLVLTVLISN